MSYIFNRTNIVIIIVIGLIFVFVTNELVKLSAKFQLGNIQAYISEQFRSDVYKSQEVCQDTSMMLCEYEMCDNVPTGMTYEEACGENFKEGWMPSTIPIPEFFQNVEMIRLTIEAPESTGTLEILPRVEAMSYSTTFTTEQVGVINRKNIKVNDATRLLNKVILYDLATMIAEPTVNPNNEVIYTIYIASKKAPNKPVAQADAVVRETTFTCVESQCSRELSDIIRTIIRIWGDPIIEASTL